MVATKSQEGNKRICSAGNSVIKMLNMRQELASSETSVLGGRGGIFPRKSIM